MFDGHDATSGTAPAGASTYTHGHAEPVLRSHRWRTVENSAAYLVPHLRDGQRILDVGCGPATITADLAGRLPASPVLGIDPQPAAFADLAGAPANLTLRGGNLFDDDLPSGGFDVVHAHQVLQHLDDPVAALRRMAQLAAPGGVVAVRDGDYGAMTWAPDEPDLDAWRDAYRAVHLADGHQPDAGRHLLGWAVEAGLEEVTASASTWCFATAEDRSWWAEMWADRCTAPASRLAVELQRRGHDAEAMAAAWRRWAARPDGWFAVLHGELICRIR